MRSDIRYDQWDNFGTVRFARQIEITRPGEDYQLKITIEKLTANEPIPPDRFVLKQPPGTELVRVGAEIGGAEALIGHMILRNILHRPARTLITVIGVAVEVTLVILVVGLTTGLLHGIRETNGGSRRRHHGPAALCIDLGGVQRRADADTYRAINCEN